jgi:hypothetical protein
VALGGLDVGAATQEVGRDADRDAPDGGIAAAAASSSLNAVGSIAKSVESTWTYSRMACLDRRHFGRGSLDFGPGPHDFRFEASPLAWRSSVTLSV